MRISRRTGRFAAMAVISLVASTLTAGMVVAAPGDPAPVPVLAAGSEVGTWAVQSLGSGHHVVSWTSPTRFPMTSDRPTIVGPPGLLFGAPSIDQDRRTVRASVTSPTRPDAGTLDVVLSGDRLDAAGRDQTGASGLASRAPIGAARSPLDLPGTQTLGVDPGTPGPHAVVTSDYTLAPVAMGGMPEPIEMVGHVVEPAPDAATGPRPLVVFLHGRHGVCYDPDDRDAWSETWPCKAPFREIPSQLGYDYMQQVLASQGYATVSVRANGINAQDYNLQDGGADARAQLLTRHLSHWATLAASHQVDLDRVVMVGHSRGGEGVDRAALRTPLSAPYRIAGQVLIAPTDFATQTAPYVPTVTLLPACDGDVSDLQGQKFTDTARDLASGDNSLKSSVMVMGANHNYFNTEWTPRLAEAPSFDDWYGDKDATCGRNNAQRLKPRGQQAVGTAYVAGAVHLFAGGDQGMLPLFDGSRARVASQGAAQTLSHAIGGGRALRLPGVTTGLSLADGAKTRFCRGSSETERVASCGYGVNYSYVRPNWSDGYEPVPTRTFFQMSWTRAGQSGGMVLDQPLDVVNRSLALRTIVDPRSKNLDLRVRLTDTVGGAALLTPVGGGTLPALGDTPDTEKLWTQSLVVDPSAASGLDLARIKRVELVSVSQRGRVWVADVASAPAALPAVPLERLPTINLSRLRITEGDSPRSAIAEVPFTVVGEVKSPARFVVLTSGQKVREEQRFTVDIAPGQTSGTIPVGYTRDRRHDLYKTVTQIGAWPARGLMTDRYVGALTVIDDDPPPAITVRPLKRRVVEGQPATWRIRLSGRVDYDFPLLVDVVRGSNPTVSVNDVPKKWINPMVGVPKRGSLPLWKASIQWLEDVRKGRRFVDIVIPTVRDTRSERPESVTVKVTASGFRATRTIKVVDAGRRGR